MKWTRKELIESYLEFFKKKGHAIIPSAPLVPEHDPTVLFTTAGMHPLVPFLLGQPHPLGKRLVDVQKCIRTQDIDEVGDTYHHTFFEMLGNWSLGDYFKKEAIEFSFEFLTKVLKIPIEKLAVTCFKGDKDASKDEEAAKIWQSLGISKERIAFLGKEDNWWGPAGNTGPCGPDSEMFYWRSDKKVPKKFNPNDKTWVEIWNDVFMQYVKDEKGNYNEAKQKNIDTGMGVERTISILNGLTDDYLTETFLPIIKEIEKLSGKSYKDKEIAKYMRIIADHIKASVFIIADGVIPGNTEQGYVLRRLIRLAIRYGNVMGIKNFITKLVPVIINIYPDYKNLKENEEKIKRELQLEEEKFLKALEQGLKQAEKIFRTKVPLNKEKVEKFRLAEGKTEEKISEILQRKKQGKDYSLKKFKLSEEEIDNSLITKEEAFYLYQSFGLPKEMLIDMTIEKKLLIDTVGFEEEQKKHQELSRTAAEGKFKSGLADSGEETTRLHTATHLLNEALRRVLSKDISQKGSNITSERLRFDFNFPRKLTEEEIKKVEDEVNRVIKKGLEIKKEEMTPEEAKKKGAQSEFGTKYPKKVYVYTAIDPDEKNGWYSMEICMGPHIKNTKELGKFKIIKEEASAAGIRRIKAVLE